MAEFLETLGQARTLLSSAAEQYKYKSVSLPVEPVALALDPGLHSKTFNEFPPTVGITNSYIAVSLTPSLVQCCCS